MDEYIEKKRLTILKIIKNRSNPISSNEIASTLKEMGYDISERTVRFDLLALDNEGFTEYQYKKGRKITEKGMKEISKARVFNKLGFLTAKIDQMTYKMDFDISSMTGTVVLNTSIIEKKYLKQTAPLLQRVFEHRLGMGSFMTLIPAGEWGEWGIIPEGSVGIGTVCSITINGILLTQGIPTRSRFGGLLEMVNNEPKRFVALINYDGTSLDPLEIFINSGMTDYLGATSTGDGLIGASFREIPYEGRDKVIEISKKLDKTGLGAFMKIGYPEQDLCGIPVNSGTFGTIIVGGLNPVAILVESGFYVESKALSGLVDFKKLFHYKELDTHIKKILG